MKTFSLRFDIDTPDCLTRGVPNLIELANKMGVQFTFFLSIGRSISRRGTLMRKLRSASSAPCAPSLSAREKLGLYRFFKLALLNPKIGANHPDLVRLIAQSQELGLHGGRNHDHWHHGGQLWSKDRVAEELDWALERLSRIGVKVRGFSCPGWTEPKDLVELLKARGFSFRADIHGTKVQSQREGDNFVNVATNLLGEPGGVAFFENLRAQGFGDSEILKTFAEILSEAGPHVVAYDHPYYAGIQELKLIEQCVQKAKDSGFEIVPLGSLAQNIQGRV